MSGRCTVRPSATRTSSRGDKPHRYVFRLHALDEPLRPPSGARVDDVRRGLAAHQVASGTLVGRYGR
ncbi:hypothetical protein [Parafrankia sp. Ea1.12]|uniref:hypothetical protein n=1 Tax=Parafrankia TaxID=2994362 RepID=UPI0009F3AD7D|nr:hypothetical protein E0504_36155 [Parafrankia sp. BMG5.11]